jgi:hypothetical protein
MGWGVRVHVSECMCVCVYARARTRVCVCVRRHMIGGLWATLGTYAERLFSVITSKADLD